jgi:hypothetical protein
MAMKELIRFIVGYRDDVNLQGLWWHRLLSVLYTVSAIAVGLAAATLIVTNARPALRQTNITVKATLADRLSAQIDPKANVAKDLSATPGHLGLLRPDGSFKMLSDYSMHRSYCTNDPRAALAEIAEHLNSRDYTRENTEASVLAQIDRSVGSSNTQDVCWFETFLRSEVQNASWGDIVKFDFTSEATLKVQVRNLLVVALVLLGLHVVVMTFYHRGFVYVVCGPRRG